MCPLYHDRDKTTTISLQVKCDRTYLTTEMLNDKLKSVPEEEIESTFPLPMIRNTDTKPQTNSDEVCSTISVLVFAYISHTNDIITIWEKKTFR